MSGHFNIEVRVFNPSYVRDVFALPISGVDKLGNDYTDFVLDCDNDYFDADDLEGSGGYIEVELNDTYRVNGWTKIEVLNWDDIYEALNN